MTNTFQEDLWQWNAAELEFMRLLKERNPRSIVTQSEGYEPRFDVAMEHQGVDWFFEIKHDIKCEETGNIAVEVGSEWKEWWVYTTISDFYIYKICWEFYCIKTDKLKELVDWKKRIKWWDWNRADLVLLKLEDYKKYFTIYK